MTVNLYNTSLNSITEFNNWKFAVIVKFTNPSKLQNIQKAFFSERLHMNVCARDRSCSQVFSAKEMERTRWLTICVVSSEGLYLTSQLWTGVNLVREQEKADNPSEVCLTNKRPIAAQLNPFSFTSVHTQAYDKSIKYMATFTENKSSYPHIWMIDWKCCVRAHKNIYSYSLWHLI